MAHTSAIDECEICDSVRQADYQIRDLAVCRECHDVWMSRAPIQATLDHILATRGSVDARHRFGIVPII